MKRYLYIAAFLLLGASNLMAQNVEARIVADPAASTATNTVVRFSIRTKAGTQLFVGLSMYFLFQNGILAPQSTGNNTVVGVNDAQLVTTWGWGVGTRTTTPNQTIPTSVYDGRSYDRRYVYINTDETGGGNVQTLTTAWQEVFSITFNNLSGTYPQGGYGYLQETAEFALASLTNENGVNVPIDVTTGSVALGPGVVTPVTFANYDLKCGDKGTSLTWSTASEADSKSFEVQKSLNGTTWTVIGDVPAAGNSNVLRKYQYLDLEGGDASYRIRQVDMDGRFEYTTIKRISCTSKQVSAIVYPVPTSGTLNVAIKTDRPIRTELQVYDMAGRIVHSQAASLTNGSNNLTINVSRLAVGEYLLRSTDGSLLLNKKFTIAR